MSLRISKITFGIILPRQARIADAGRNYWRYNPNNATIFGRSNGQGQLIHGSIWSGGLPKSLSMPFTVEVNGKTVSFTVVPSKVYRDLRYKQETLQDVIPERFRANCLQFGLDPATWLKICKEETQLYYQLPKTIYDNIAGMAKLLGIKRSALILAAIRHPQLFYQSPETINWNIKKGAELLGIEKSVYGQAALKQPPLFSQKPKTINDNIERAAQMLGLNKSIYVQMALMHPSLFCSRAETIHEGYKILRLMFDSNEVLNEYIVRNPAALALSQERNFMHYIARKITGRKTKFAVNPLKYLAKRFQDRQDVFRKLKDILISFVERSRAVRKDKTIGKEERSARLESLRTAVLARAIELANA